MNLIRKSARFFQASLLVLLVLLTVSFQPTAFAATAKQQPQKTSLQRTQGPSLGEMITMESKVLGEERSFQVYLPPGYHQSSKQYPVLYVLDGQWYFTNAVAIGQSLRLPNILPQMIVVGIVNSNPRRRQLFGAQTEQFQQYLADEVLPFVDSNFRTSKERLLFGWEMGAFFAG
ncbi:MAG: esterase family protein, partial [Psychrosphaera sp.]|nr:esterase family protein [Psychrosphaera sp.]